MMTATGFPQYVLAKQDLLELLMVGDPDEIAETRKVWERKLAELPGRFRA